MDKPQMAELATLAVLNAELDELTNMLYEVRASVKECSETVHQMAQYIADKEGKGVGVMFDLPIRKEVKR
tara:strand:+ start:408 stop:617 length:210 start_codon:yes stop_codon:yes gene_type:complete